MLPYSALHTVIISGNHFCEIVLSRGRRKDRT
nr:MAG TPA: tRNA-splicing ligase RtcB [Caudoviricetes sp.]